MNHPLKLPADSTPVPQVAAGAPAWPSFTGTSQLVGTSPSGHATLYVDASLGAPALKNARDLVSDADRVMTANDALFGTTGGPVSVIVFAVGGRTDGTGGADHLACNYQTGGAIEVCAAFGNSARVSALFEAELSECSMGGNLCGMSTGEALSRWCAAVIGGNALSDFATAPQWARDGMPNHVDQTAPTDQDADSTGCGMAFLSWLMSRGHALNVIAPAMVSLGDRGTLAQVYGKLSGDAPSNAWPAFLAAVQALPGGVTNDDPFGGAARPAQFTQGSTIARTPTPITHVVIITKENHTFDNYFGAFPGANGEVLPHAADPHPDQGHGHDAWLKSHGAAGVTGAAKTQYQATDIPAYWAFAQQYTLCDNYFTDVASQSEPNHLFLIAADSPLIDNTSHGRNYQSQPPFDMPSLPQALADAQRTWRNYAEPNSSYFDHIKALQGNPWNVPSSQFDTDVAKGFLPDVSWLYAPFGDSEHPGSQTVAQGAAWTAQRVLQLARSSLWASAAIIITWDDWGGWYDHVAAPGQSQWAGTGPAGYQGSQFRYGPRVPCLIISPYARQEINHHYYSHASVVKFCIRLFGLTAWNVPALAPGDPSGDLFEAFDFAAPPRLAVPTLIPA